MNALLVFSKWFSFWKANRNKKIKLATKLTLRQQRQCPQDQEAWEPGPSSLSSLQGYWNSHLNSNQDWGSYLLLCWESGKKSKPSPRELEWQSLQARGKANISEGLPGAGRRKLLLSFFRLPAEWEECCVTAPVRGWWSLATRRTPGGPCLAEECSSQQQVICVEGIWGKAYSTLGFLQHPRQKQAFIGGVLIQTAALLSLLQETRSAKKSH